MAMKVYSLLLIAAALVLSGCQSNPTQPSAASTASQADMVALLTSGDGTWEADNEGYKRTFKFTETAGQIHAEMIAGERYTTVKSSSAEVKGGKLFIVFVDNRGKHRHVYTLKGNEFVGTAGGPTAKVGGSYMHTAIMRNLGAVEVRKTGTQ